MTFWRYADIVREFCPIAIDCHNVQSRLEEEYLANMRDGSDEEKSRRRMALATMLAVEQRYRHLPAIVCSEEEGEALLERGFERQQIAIIHNTVEIVPRVEGERSFPPRILFCGMMNYRPNARAALDLVREIFPRVTESMAEAQLWIVGMNPTAELLQAARGRANVFVTGEVSETSSYFRSAAVLSVPLAFGGGTRFKILEAFNYRLPVVSSPKGCEGLAVVDRRHLLIARDFAQHAHSLVAVIRDQNLAASLTGEAASLLRERYSFPTAARQWDDCLRRFRPMFARRTAAAATREP
jgi:glycosyltransferase involved in cell wall biosynthesis